MNRTSWIVFGFVALGLAAIVAYVYLHTRPEPSRGPFESILHELGPYAPAIVAAL